MIWFGEEAEALLKQLEKLFKRIVVLAEDDLAIVERGGDTRYAGHNGAFESIWLSEIGSRYATLKEFVRWKPLPMLRPREYKYNPIIKERI